MLNFKVRGQEGAIPRIGFGTATLFKEKCTQLVLEAIKGGCRNIDTALLYDNQEAVGQGIREAIAAGEVKREDLFVVTKVGFYPGTVSGTYESPPKEVQVHLSFYPENKKGYAETAAAVDLCLKKLGLDYVDLILIHNPCATVDEYQASTVCHNFELGRTAFTDEERQMILDHRKAKAHSHYDIEAAEAARASTWKALEAAKAAGKCRFIGVSNYSPFLVRNMENYATIQPAVNQLELHPWASSPTLRALAAEMGMALTAYGSGNSVWCAKSPVVAAIAAARGISATAVILKWTLAKNVSVIPRTSTPTHIAENQRAGEAPHLLPEDIAQLDALNKARFFCSLREPRCPSPLPPGLGTSLTLSLTRTSFFPALFSPSDWEPMPMQPPGAKPDC